MRIKSELLILFFLAFTGCLFGQSAAIDNVISVNVRNIGVIKNNNEIRRYYLFYELDKIDRKTSI